jgi:hypothetical protein
VDEVVGQSEDQLATQLDLVGGATKLSQQAQVKSKCASAFNSGGERGAKGSGKRKREQEAGPLVKDIKRLQTAAARAEDGRSQDIPLPGNHERHDAKDAKSSLLE